MNHAENLMGNSSVGDDCGLTRAFNDLIYVLCHTSHFLESHCPQMRCDKDVSRELISFSVLYGKRKQLPPSYNFPTISNFEIFSMVLFVSFPCSQIYGHYRPSEAQIVCHSDQSGDCQHMDPGIPARLSSVSLF